MSASDPVVIVGMARTPMGGLLGDLSGLSANELGAIAVKAAVEEARLGSDEADEIIMGNCLPAGQGQAPARQSGFKAGMDKNLEATTINKMCGSGMQAAVMGRNAILAGDADVVIAGGMESMTNAPHLMDVRGGHKYGAMQAQDHMALDGLSDAYTGGPMGAFADAIAEQYQFTREQQDAYALETLSRAQSATEGGNSSARLRRLRSKTAKAKRSLMLMSCRAQRVRKKFRVCARLSTRAERSRQRMPQRFPMARLRLS